MRPQQEEAEAALEAAVRAVYGWLGANVVFYGTLHSDRSDPGMYLGFLRDGVGATGPDAEQETVRERQHLLLFAGYRDGQAVVTGFAQFGGVRSALHTVGVHDSHHHTGITTAMLQWMLSGLPASYGPGFMRYGTYNDNAAMIALGQKFGAGEGHVQRFGAEGEDPEKMGSKLYDIPHLRACELLGINGPSGEEFHFPCGVVRGVAFRILYFGRHPRRLGPNEQVVTGTL